ncbi:MAG TPA: SAM-dependent methyltransferase [Rhizomicrobium sp.]|nr:SAM-dependent methyltransferase [Rhizomicrobium sp.]
MNPLGERILRTIRATGPLPVSTFMSLALLDPKAGFYASREAIGTRGAFITAPEISQIFGELLALWCAQLWRDQGSPGNPRLIELGPGRGTLMRDALRALRGAPDFLESLEVVLVEASPMLKESQQELLRNAHLPVCWVQQWSEIVQDRPLFLLANEFLDALPIRQFVMTIRGWCERVVMAAGDELGFALSPHPVPLIVSKRRGVAEPGAVLEISTAAEALVEDISRAVATQGGAALFIDYGHAADGFGDTLQAVAHHNPVDVLACPGEADLSAHVDFASMAESARRGGAQVCPLLEQGTLLRALGIEIRADILASADPACATEVRNAVLRLTDRGAMGALFKAMAVTPPGAPSPPGFE